MKKIWCWGFILLFLVPVVTGASDVSSGLIAVASDEKTQPANVSSQAARCKYYLIFNSEGKLTDVIDNPNIDASGGAGSSAADFLYNKGVTVVVAESFGSKMINAMKSKGITFTEFKGIAGDAVKEVLKRK